MQEPTLVDIFRARRTLRGHLAPTPLHSYPALDELLGAKVHVKHENHLPTGAFKIRGGIVFMSGLSPEARRRGVVTASTGNHGQSIAHAAGLFGARAVIFAPEGANPVKIEAIRAFGAEVVLHGADFEAAKAGAQAMAEAEAEGLRFISSGDEPDLIAGVGTYGLEIMQEVPEVEIIFVPVGGGSGAAGTCIAAKGVNPEVRIIAVQAEAAKSAYLTWKNRRAIEAPLTTEAEGLSTGAPFMLPQRILWRHLDDFLLVDDPSMRRAVRIYLEKAKTLAELAGAAPLAAALQMKEALAGKTIALVLSGGNISPDQLRACLS